MPNPIFALAKISFPIERSNGKMGEYIRRIEIDSLWSGQKHIVWELNRKVNILSGVNGVGRVRF
jgi:hypothetical protein